MSGMVTMVYLLCAVLFIRSLGGLSRQETAGGGNLSGIVGMLLALGITAATWVTTSHGTGTIGVSLLAGAVILGAVVGLILAARVEMTGMPELVAILHSFVGLAAVCVGLSSYLAPHHPVEGVAKTVMEIEVWLGVAVGAITFTGSILAWAKLRGSISGKPLLLPGRHLINLAMVSAIVVLAVPFLGAESASAGLPWLLAMTAISGVLGVHLVVAIGGADMPVVVSLLNSYSGWAAAASGFMLGNDLLIVTGALVGSSGAILSIIMCRAMNRSILNVVFGGFGTAEGAAPSAAALTGTVHELKADQVAEELRHAHSVIIVPGYGMAVARAQSAVRDLAMELVKRGVKVRFAIHPVAGRLPGHMNVLLAEAGISYETVEEMEHINGDFPGTDVALVIGANDIVNPGALEDPSSPIYGMPVLEVWKAKTVVILKRGMAAGYAGVDNPLFLRDNAQMLFGDARKSIDALLQATKDGSKGGPSAAA